MLACRLCIKGEEREGSREVSAEGGAEAKTILLCKTLARRLGSSLEVGDTKLGHYNYCKKKKLSIPMGLFVLRPIGCLVRKLVDSPQGCDSVVKAKINTIFS